MILKKLSILLILLQFSIGVFADMGAPALKEYIAIVTNENGAEIFDSTKKEYIPYMTEVTAVEENDEYTTVKYEGVMTKIKTDDIEPKEKFDESKLKNNSIDAIVLVDNLSLREGPASSYEEIIKIKKGEQITVHDSIEDGSYKYVSYKDKKGFVVSANGTIGTKYGRILTIVGMDLVNEDGLTLINIPKHSELKEVYKTDYWDGIQFYAEYNGKKGFLNTSKFTGNTNEVDPGKLFATADTGYVEVQAGSKLYGNIDNKLNISEELVTIEEDIKLDIIYYYVYHMNQMGNTIYNEVYNTFLFVEYNDVRGWLPLSENAYSDDPGKHIYLNEDFTLNDKFKTEEEKEEEKQKEKEKKEEEVKEKEKDKEREINSSKLDNTTIIIMVICGTVVLIVTIIAIAVVVSKRKLPTEPNVIGPDVLASTTLDQEEESKKTRRSE